MNREFIQQYIKDAKQDPWFYVAEPLLFLAALGVGIWFFGQHIIVSVTIR